jgi:hypothetical protein
MPFGAKEYVVIALFGSTSAVITGMTVTPLTALSAGLLPPPFWAGMSFLFFAVLSRFLVGRHGTNTLVGTVVGAVGIFMLPLGFFALVACPTQGAILDLMLAILGDKRAASGWKCFLAAGIANAWLTFIVMYFFFGSEVAFPWVWWEPLAALSGGAFGLIGHLTGKRLVRLAPQWAVED